MRAFVFRSSTRAITHSFSVSVDKRMDRFSRTQIMWSCISRQISVSQKLDFWSSIHKLMKVNFLKRCSLSAVTWVVKGKAVPCRMIWFARHTMCYWLPKNQIKAKGTWNWCHEYKLGKMLLKSYSHSTGISFRQINLSDKLLNVEYSG